MSHDVAEEARRLKRSAEKKLSGFRLFGRARRQEEAAELFARAGAKFRVCKQWNEAAEAHVLAAHNYQSSSDDNWVDARKNYEDAAKCFKKVNPEDAIPVYKSAAELSLQHDSISIAGKLFKSLAEMIEEEQLEIDEALYAYRRAAECFEAEDAERNRNEMYVNIASICAKKENFEEAIRLYDLVGRSAAKLALRQPSSTSMFNATVCRLADPSTSVEEAENNFEQYKELSDSFERSRQGQFLEDLFDAIREANLDSWDNAIEKYSSKEVLVDFVRSLLAQARQHKLSQSGLGGDIDLQ